MQNVNLWVVNWWWNGMEGKKLHKWLWNPSIWTPWLQVTTIILSYIQDTKSKWLSWYLLLCGRWYMVNVKRLILTIHSKRTLWKISRCFERVEDSGIKWEGEWKKLRYKMNRCWHNKKQWMNMPPKMFLNGGKIWFMVHLPPP
jgi:hypothetical protein